MQLLYPLYYRQHGVRRVQNLLAPVLSTFASFPRDSMYHAYSLDEDHPDIDVSKLYFQSARRVLVDYPDTLTGDLGHPRKKSIVLRTLFRDFHVKNKRYRYMKDHFEAVNDQLTLFVENYSYLHKVYMYQPLPLAGYYKWHNLQKTIWDNIARINKIQPKNHFVEISLPDLVPSFNFLRMYSKVVNTTMVRVFDHPGKLLILHLFRWLEGDTSTVFSSLTGDDLIRVNLVFTAKDGRASVLNMGYLHSWVQNHKNETEFKQITQLPVLQLQKVFLKYLMILTSALPDEVADAEVVEPGTSLPEIEDPQDRYDDGVDGDDEDQYSDPVSIVAKKTTGKRQQELDKTAIVDDIAAAAAMNGDIDMDAHIKSIDKELETLEVMTKRNLKEKGLMTTDKGEVAESGGSVEDTTTPEELLEELHTPESYDQALKRQIDEQADYGLLSATDYKKLIQDIDNHTKMQDPYGSKQTAVQAAVIQPEELKLDEQKTTIVAGDVVKDKSMLRSSLLAFDKAYIDTILQKDLLACVGGIQKAGVVVRKHEIEIDHSALGTFENHTLELKPIDGMASTIRYRIPMVKDDGTFTHSGNKYIMRKQRVDLPIRKVSPQSVALTTYYGKTFVTISPKKSNNSLEWIDRKLNEAVLSEEPTLIKQVNTADVFDNYFKAPFIYNALAHRYKSIVTTKFTLNFDHEERKEWVGDDLIAKLETGGSVLVGYTTKKEPITVDTLNQFFIHSNGTVTPMGDIYQALGLHAQDAPVDFSEVKVFSKAVPVGAVLAYYIGFSKLVKVLKAKYRKVEPRKQLMLEAHEYAIRFKDGAYVFSRNNGAASLILSGLNEFEKDLKRYPVEDFDQKDIYLNLLESKGLSSLYIRELGLMNQLFVDPISKGVLEQMHEPVTFVGLLIRASELLQTYEHPDTQDMSAMRIRGYERIPGAIYTELVRSVRQYRNKNIAGRSKIDMSPYQVQSVLMKDPAMKLIEDINPIQNLKETEVVTYVGEGGRSKETMSKPTRAYHKTDMGIVSEATVDSTDVGVNAYLSANPEFEDLRGIPKKEKKIEPSSLVSTSALLAPGASVDD